MDSVSSLSSTLAAAGLGGEKAKMSMALVGRQLRTQRETMTSLMDDAVKAGNVTATRGQNVNISA